MKIISRGQKHLVAYRGECRNCDSVMEAASSELKIESDTREGDSFAHAKCPVCGNDFILYPTKATYKPKKRTKH